MLRFPTWKVALILGVCAARRGAQPAQSVPARADGAPAGLAAARADQSRARPAGRLAPAARGRPARGGRGAARRRWSTTSAAMLRPARIGYRGLGVRGDAVALTLTDPASAGAGGRAARRPQPQSARARARGGRGRRRADRRPADRERDRRAAGCRRCASRSRSCAGGSTRSARASRPSSGRATDRILVQVPGEKDPESIKRLLGQTAKLTFHLVDLETPRRSRRSPAICRPARCCCRADEPTGQSQVVVRKRVEVSGESLVDAQPTYQENQPVVSFRFDTAGGAQVRRRHPRARRRAARHRARRQGDQLAPDPRADPRRQRRDLRQLHGRSRPTSWRCCCAPAPCRRRSRSSRSARSGPISAPTRSRPARSPAWSRWSW